MARINSEEKCFTFLWKLQNISYSVKKTGEGIDSPTFVVEAIENTSWYLSLYPRGYKDGKYIACYLQREEESEGAVEIEIKYELSVIRKDGSVFAPNAITKDAFQEGSWFGCDDFMKRAEVYSSHRSTFLPEDTLTVRCRIWKSCGEIEEDVRCTALTRIGVEKRSYRWNVKNFSAFEPEKKCTYQIKSIEHDTPLMSTDMFLTGGLFSEGIVHFDLTLHDKSIRFCTLQLHLIDASKNSVECNQDEFWFDSLDECKRFTFFFTMKKLLAEKNVFLRDDILSLHWEWTFSEGVVLEVIEQVQYGYACLESKVSDAHKVNNDTISFSNTLIDNVKSLYDEHFLCDVNLRTNNTTFAAHKFILSASSSVFKAMFSSDMKEKVSDCVNIEDLSDDTISRMLHFMYTTRVGDLTWELAAHLYAAADKYDILSLKTVCSSFLKENISPSNACEMLTLAHLHADGDLKSDAQDYILKNAKQITNSEEWNLLMETNSKLAAETLCLLFK